MCPGGGDAHGNPGTLPYRWQQHRTGCLPTCPRASVDLLGAAASTIDGCGEGSAGSPSTPAAAAQSSAPTPLFCPPTGAVQRRASHHHHLLLHHKHHRLMRRSRRQTELTLAPLRRRGSTPKRWSPAQSIFLPSGLRAIASDGLDGSGFLLSRSRLPPFLRSSIPQSSASSALPPLSNHRHFIVVVSPASSATQTAPLASLPSLRNPHTCPSGRFKRAQAEVTSNNPVSPTNGTELPPPARGFGTALGCPCSLSLAASAPWPATQSAKGTDSAALLDVRLSIITASPQHTQS